MKRAILTMSEGDGLSLAVVRHGFLYGALMLTGCVQVQAPEKPIEINLNVNIKQEVVYRLQQDAEELIENNPELFPQ